MDTDPCVDSQLLDLKTLSERIFRLADLSRTINQKLLDLVQESSKLQFELQTICCPKKDLQGLLEELQSEQELR